MNVVSEQRERLRQVRESLDILAEGEAVTLAEAANEGSDAYRQVLRKVLGRLVDMKILVRMAPDGVGQPVRFKVLNPPALDSLRRQEEKVADVIWPSSATPDAPPEEETASQPVFVAPTVAPQQEEPLSVDEKLDTMMRVLHTALTALVTIKEKVEVIETKVNRLHAELTGDKE